MLTELCQELRNWFPVSEHYGTFEISNGALTASFFQTGQYYRIIGSVFNDGIWRYGYDELTDETFDGSVWGLGIPLAVVNLSNEIDAWVEQYGDAQNSPYTSESFGGYSYTKGTSNGGSGGATWQDVFRSRLNRYRKL